MPLLTQIEVANERYTRAVSRFDMNSNAIEAEQNRIAQNAKDIDIYEKLDEIDAYMDSKLKEYMQELIHEYPKDLVDRAYRELHSMFTGRYKHALSAAKGNLEGAKIRLADNTRALHIVEEELEDLRSKGLDKPTTISKDSLKQDLANVTNVDTKTIGVGKDNNEKAYVRWVFTGLTLRPDENPYTWLKGDPVIKLQDILVEITLDSRHITIKPKRGERELCKFVWGTDRRVHPHVLDIDIPCLGDFTGPVHEAIDEHDWETVAGLLKLFLSSAITGDVAGANWIRAIVPYGYASTTYACLNTDAEQCIFVQDTGDPLVWKEEKREFEPDRTYYAIRYARYGDTLTYFKPVDGYTYNLPDALIFDKYEDAVNYTTNISLDSSRVVEVVPNPSEREEAA